VNQTNIAYQSQNLEIQELYKQMKNCIEALVEIITIQEKIPKEPNDLQIIPWSDESIQEYIWNDEEFIRRMGRELHPNLLAIESLSDQEKKKKVLDFCKNFLLKLIQEMVNYLPLGSKEIKLFDFVKLEKKEEVKQKILEFNKVFKLEYDESQIVTEINKLFGEEFFRSRFTLETWTWIENQYNQRTPKRKPEFPILSNIFKLVHVLPVSSAGVEQSFSTLKTLKSSLRNQLKESTVESIMFIQQGYDHRKPFEISNRLLEIYSETKKQLKKVRIQLKSISSNFNNDMEEEKSFNSKNLNIRQGDHLTSKLKNLKKTSEDYGEKENQEDKEAWVFSDEELNGSGEIIEEEV